MNRFYKNIKEEQVPAPKILRKICIEVCQNMLVINLKRVLGLFAEFCRPTRLCIQNWDIARFVVKVSANSIGFTEALQAMNILAAAILM
jgi:hypothetical protein